MGANAAINGAVVNREKKSWTTPVQSMEELQLVQRYMILGILISALEHDIGIMSRSEAKFRNSYISFLRGVQDRVLLDKAGLGLRFRARGISVHEEKRGQDGLIGAYLCRGYQHRFTMLWGAVRKECDEIIKNYCQASS
ncbi:hypothetical protein ACX93W_00590 [Paenibacillus sp. CAU 1782]